MEWGLQPAEADRLKAKIEELRKVRLVHEEREDPLLRRRSQLTYGRLYLNNSVQSFEVRSRAAFLISGSRVSRACCCVAVLPRGVWVAAADRLEAVEARGSCARM